MVACPQKEECVTSDAFDTTLDTAYFKYFPQILPQT